ncbi:hypothetical protein BD289DRAFT_490770 [Coniella lustricola]|uniref:Uncharacterized protein n=1 Tax=Coniella lustricola TaxID=2025994 RepID=A0A2T3A039_9PEZI|nr:hypothetical protein BD289DRAFT_490770 [Coniella lustricola]
MECISPSHVPMIVHSGLGQDWTKQHMLGEQLRLACAKQQVLSPTLPQSAIATTTTTTSSSSSSIPMKTWDTRQTNAGRRTILYIPGASLCPRIEKHIAYKTPTKSAKTAKDWEQLLKTSLSGLQGLYAKLEQPPAPKAQRLADRLPKPDMAGMDRAEMVSRALQAAIGCVSAPSQQDLYEGDSTGTEYSYSSEDAPATPDTIRTNDHVDIDPRLLG